MTEADPLVSSAPPLRSRAMLGAYRLGSLMARVAPRRLGMGAAAVAGRAMALATPDRRLIVERNLRRAHGPELAGLEMASKVAATFDSYARYYYDSFRLPSLSVDEVDAGFTVDGLHHLEEVMAADGVGPILALPHLGGWEWAAFWITRIRGWRLAAVVEALEPPEVFEWFLQFRESIGIHVIPLGPQAAEQVVGACLDKEIMCLLCDRDLTGTGPEVEFFGETTRLPAGPAVMSLRTGAALLPTAVYFTPSGVHGVVRPPLSVPRTDVFRADVRALTQLLASELEQLVRRAPEQWHLMQPNWPSDHEALAARGSG